MNVKLEGAAKLHYAYVFPLELSLFVLERRSVTLQRMFVDSLEVEENLRMSRRFLDHGSHDGSDKELNLSKLHETKEIFSWHPISVSDEQKGNRYIDEKV